jgi:glycosyltransferase involved in cell wall biosynthesis
MTSNPEIQPEVSLILTVFNRAQYLKRCINSLLGQSYKNWELIAIDDGSDDNSFEVLKEFQINYPDINLIRHENMKLPLSRNKGIMASLPLTTLLFCPFSAQSKVSTYYPYCSGTVLERFFGDKNIYVVKNWAGFSVFPSIPFIKESFLLSSNNERN